MGPAVYNEYPFVKGGISDELAEALKELTLVIRRPQKGSHQNGLLLVAGEVGPEAGRGE
jgi:hypothetical protein